MIEALSSENLPAPRFRYSPLVKAGPFYKTAGMIALNKETGQLEPGGAGPETARILSNLLEALPDFRLTLDDLVSATIFTTQMDRFPEINKSWEAVFSADMRLPARSAVGATALPINAAVEMESGFTKQNKQTMRIYGDLSSGNCLKVKYTADFLGLDYDWTPVDIMQGESRAPDFLRMNPQGQVPVIQLEDGRCLAQSNAIIRYLAQGTALLPLDNYLQAKVDEWLFWEQYSHEPYIAVCRFHMLYQGKPLEARSPGGWNAARMPWIIWKIIFPAANGWPEILSLLLISHCWLTLGCA